MIIGLSGLYCAGKNYVAGLLEAAGLPVLDVDKLGHAALDGLKPRLSAMFGPGVLRGGSVDRRALGKIVFASAEKRAALEALVHPEVNRLTLEWAARQSGPCVVNAALLHKSAVFGSLDFALWVRAPWIIRLLRARRRDRLPWRDLAARLASQKDFRRNYAGGKPALRVVDNWGLPGCGGRLRRRLKTIFARYGLGLVW